MATLEKIRSRAGLLIFIVAFALLCFIVGDFLTNSTSLFRQQQNIVGTVNGEKFSREEFESSYRQLSEVSKLQQRNTEDAAIRATAWENFKQKALFNAEAENEGISVTTKELTDATIGNNPHPILFRSGLFTNQQGQFDKSLVARVIEDVNRDPNTIQDINQRNQFIERQNAERNLWLYMENNIKASLLTDKMGSLLVNAMSTPKAEVDFLASLSTKEYDALVARKLLADVNDADVQPSDAELLAYYNKVKDSKFKQEGYRDMDIILIPIQPSAQDLKDGYDNMDSLRLQLKRTSEEEQLRLLFESASEKNYQYINVFMKPDNYDRAFTEFAKTSVAGNVSEIVTDPSQKLYKVAKCLANPVNRPDSVRFSLIAVQEADSAASQRRADSIVGALRGGANFADLAAKLSKDTRSAQNGGDQGWIQEGYVSLPKFDEKAFAGKKGDVFTVNNGPVCFVIKVTDQTAPIKKAKIAILATRLEPSSTTIDSLDRIANDFVIENKTAEQFAKSAAEKHLQIRPLSKLTKGQPSTYVLPNSRCLVKWAFEHKKGDVSEVFTEIPEYYILGALTNVVDDVDGILPFESVKDEISAEVIKQKKADKLAAELNGKALAEIGTIDTAKAVRFSAPYLSNFGAEAGLVGAIVNAKMNEVSKPVKGSNSVFVIQKVAERDSQMPAIDKAALDRNIQNAVGRSLLEAIEDKGKVENNSFNFF
ncbi:MAG: SurA N-terminal domain-containing protein [Paludibacteraceae bacterium]|nr:SurA N-terminal domain-containing protein [Paludibacteraceae bacterium]